MTSHKQRFLNKAGKEPNSLDELGECCVRIIQNDSNSKIKLVGFSFSVQRNENVSNSHYAPVGLKTNWGRGDNTLPTGYPGWSGRVWMRFDKSSNHSASGTLRNTLTHSGTGGSGSYNGPWEEISNAFYRSTNFRHTMSSTIPEPKCWSWDYRFFEQDFPLLRHSYEKHRLLKILKDDANIDRGHAEYIWQDPEQRIIDDAFLDEYYPIFQEQLSRKKLR